jgi:hypothetical protein
MLSEEEEAEIRALRHIVTVLIRRISDSDEVWCRDVLRSIREQQQSKLEAGRPPDEAIRHVIAIIERALDA